MPALPIEKYQVGVVCALPKEMTAARAILDEEHEKIESQDALDHNNYVLGRVHTHNVVIACLPAGVYGNNAAAIVANNMLRTFTGLRFGLMVGIGGGIPNLEKSLDIRLGDVVVSQPDKTHGGVVQYDLGKNLGEGKFERTGFLRPPPTLLLTALATLQSQHDLDGSQIPTLLSQMIQRRPNLAKTGYVSPGSEKDCLNCARCGSLERDSSCMLCKHGKIQREARSDQSPVVHYGIIASGNQLIRNAAERDRLGREFGALCVEMEAAGLINEFPCLVIRGICDYADSHKNDAWQKYAATTAAAYAKELLSVITPAKVAEISPATDVVQKPSESAEKIQNKG
jgi:nucleoside phosphorylase